MTVFHFPGNFRVGFLNEVAQIGPPIQRAIDEDRIMLMVLLSGHQRFSIENNEFIFSTLLEKDPSPKAVFLHLRKGQAVCYSESLGTPLVKLSVTMNKDWLEHAGALIQDPSKTELQQVENSGFPAGFAQRIWAADTAMLKISEDLMRMTEEFQAGLHARSAMNLALMARGIDLLRAALTSLGLSRVQSTEALPSSPLDPRLERISICLTGNLQRPDFGPEDLAEACGLSLRSLQRLCQSAFRCSPSAYIRTQKMEAAFSSLSRGKVNVQQAAHMAGYSNAANFSTAFKRKFGVSPGKIIL